MATKHSNRKIPRPASRPLETLTKIAAQTLDGYLFIAHLLSRKVVPIAAVPQWNALTFDTDGQLWAIDHEGIVRKINRADGTSSIVGMSGVTPSGAGSATTDTRSGRIFWTTGTADGATGLYEIEKSSGKAILIYAFPDNDRVTGIYIPKPEADDSAPAAVNGLKASFADGALSGTVTFTAPTTTFGGQEASGELSYSVLVDGEEKASGTTQCGAEVSVEVSVDKSGEHEFAVTVANAAGSSPAAKIKQYIGFDTPVAPVPQATYADGKVTITWNAVSEGANGGYVDPAQVRYSITKTPGYVDIVTDYDGTSFVDESIVPTEEEKTYYYYMYAYLSGLRSRQSSMAKVTVKKESKPEGIEPPYSQDFSASTALTGFETINKKGRNTWTRLSGQAMFEGDAGAEIDVWLITPPFSLEAEKFYELSFQARSSNDGPIEMEVFYGTNPTDMTERLIGPETLSLTTLTTYSRMLTAPADDVYYIGFHFTGGTDAFRVWFDNLSLGQGVDVRAPGPVSDFTVTPDAAGLHSVEISFVTPSVDDSGNSIASLTKAEIYRGEELIASFDKPGTKQTLSFTDNEAPAGLVKYSAMAYTEAGKGRAVECEVFVGINRPQAVKGISVSDNDGLVSIEWQPVSIDIDGKAIPAGGVTYTVLTTDTEGKPVVAAETAATSCTYQAVAADDEQRFMLFSVVATTEGGASDSSLSDYIPVGKPYAVPYHESFAGTRASHVHGITILSGKAGWQMFNDTRMQGMTSFDSDGGYMAMVGVNEGDAAEISTGKISLAGLTSPVLTYHVFNYDLVADTPDNNTVQVLVNGGDGFVSVDEQMLSLLPGGWSRVIVPLDGYVGRTVTVKFRAAVNTFPQTHIDNIRVMEKREANVALSSISAPEYIRPDEPHEITVGVENTGMTSASSLTVTLLLGGKVAGTATVAALGAGQHRVLKFPGSLSVADAPAATYMAVVDWSGDTAEDDNAAEAPATNVLVPQYASVRNLAGEGTDAGQVLSWDAPDLSESAPAEKYEDFEAFTPFGMEGENGWQFVDADKLLVSGVLGFNFPNIPAPNTGTMAWFVMDASYSTIAGNRLYQTVDGSKYLSNMCIYDGGTVDDWCISPELFGGRQIVSFLARSFTGEYPETLEVLCSDGGTATSDFISLAVYKGLSSSWKRYYLEVPDGARRLAFRAVSTDAFMLHIDGISFIPEGAPASLELKSYNIYRDGQRINSEPVLTTTFTDSERGLYSYAVAPVYDKGEGPVCEAISVGTSGINGAVASGISVYAVSGGVVIEGAVGEDYRVVSPDGRLAATGTVVSGRQHVGLSAGLYIVNCGGRSVKVFIR